MFGVMGFFFPAGLSLYISTNTILTLFHHLYMHRSGGSEPAKAAVEPAPSATGLAKVKREAPAVIDVEASGEDEGDEDDDGVVRNGQRPRGQGPGRSTRSGPGRRGGKRKRSTRSS
jgi:membrane protein insertase Oxa1/YidC/SpoIIIJ